MSDPNFLMEQIMQGNGLMKDQALDHSYGSNDMGGLDPGQVHEFHKLVQQSDPDVLGVNRLNDPTFLYWQNTTQNPTLGESIINGLDKMKKHLDHDYEKIFDNASGLVKKDSINAGDAMMLQAEVMAFGLKMELSTNIVKKGTQHVDTFLKSQ